MVIGVSRLWKFVHEKKTSRTRHDSSLKLDIFFSLIILHMDKILVQLPRSYRQSDIFQPLPIPKKFSDFCLLAVLLPLHSLFVSQYFPFQIFASTWNCTKILIWLDSKRYKCFVPMLLLIYYWRVTWLFLHRTINIRIIASDNPRCSEN